MTRVEMNLRPETVAEVERVTELLGAVNRTDAVVTSVWIAALVMDAIRSGGKVLVVQPDGESGELVVPGMEKTK